MHAGSSMSWLKITSVNMFIEFLWSFWKLTLLGLITLERMQRKARSHVAYHYNNLLLFAEFCAPQSPGAEADSTGGKAQMFNCIAWNVAFPFLSPLCLWLAPGSLTHCSLWLSWTGTGQSYLPEEGTQQGLELQLSLHKMAILKGTKLDKLSLISRLLVPFQQWFLEWQDPHVGVGLRWSQGKGLLIVSSGIAE